tara:strand:- start:212 stop:424 length:213 start_codon:yes stop_codon:yes gene_type:complete
MKVGDLVRSVGFENNRLFIVLEARTFPEMAIGKGHFREERTEIRLHCTENPFLKKTFCSAHYFELISEAK